MNINKHLPTVGLTLAGVIVAGGLIANTFLLNNRVTQLEKFPVKVIVATPTVEVTATPSATITVKPTGYFKYISPTFKAGK